MGDVAGAAELQADLESRAASEKIPVLSINYKNDLAGDVSIRWRTWRRPERMGDEPGVPGTLSENALQPPDQDCTAFVY